MNSSEKIHWKVVNIRRRNDVYKRDGKNLYQVELMGLFFPGESIFMTINVYADRPKKIRNWFFPVRSNDEIVRIQSI